VDQWVMLAWAIEGPVLLFLGFKYRYQPVRIAGFLILLLSTGKLFIHFIFEPLHKLPFNVIINSRLAQALFIVVCLFAYALIHHRYRDKPSDDEWFLKATKGMFKGLDRILKIVAAIGAGYLAMLILSEEFKLAFDLKRLVYSSCCLLTVFWALGSLAFLELDVRLKSKAGRFAGLFPLFISMVLAVACYDFTWPKDSYLILNQRFLAVGAALAILFLYGYLLKRQKELKSKTSDTLSIVVFVSFAFFLFIILSMEPYKYCKGSIEIYSQAKWAAKMSLSIVWGLYAIGLITVGFWKKLRPLRFAGLGLFAITGVKLLLVDMAGLEQGYRIVSFLVMGILMIGASYLYHRLEKLIEQPVEGKEK